jgi:hypothetical protein
LWSFPAVNFSSKPHFNKEKFLLQNTLSKTAILGMRLLAGFRKRKSLTPSLKGSEENKDNEQET